MKYELCLRGDIDAFNAMNGLHIADLGTYMDRRIWLCYHLQDVHQARIAIEWCTEDRGTIYDIITDLGIEQIEINNEEIPYITNIERIKPIGVNVAKFIYDMDNNRKANK